MGATRRLLGLGVAVGLIAGCSGEPPEGSAAHLLYEVDGADALPREALATLGEAALPYWSRCGEMLVTRDRGRSGEREPRMVAAAPIALHVDAEDPLPSDAETPWRAVARVSSGRHRIAEPGQPWSDWVGLTALDLPVWTLRRNASGWTATFRPQADSADSARYELQYASPPCSELPDAPG